MRRENKAAAGEVLHYATGRNVGCDLRTGGGLNTAGKGLAFGTSVWMAVDNALVPALGLAKPPTKTPLSTHIYALSSHLVYGFITETVRRTIRAIL